MDAPFDVVPAAAIAAARSRVDALVRTTACRRSEHLGRLIGGEVHLKLENTQETGSFKLRGVANAILSLPRKARRRPLVAASTGNHGAAFAHLVGTLGLEGRLFMPRTASAGKIERLRSTGLPLELVGADCVEAENAGARWASEHGGVWISPYNDRAVVAGQGTVAVELLRQLEDVDDVLVPVGGGGLISGVASYLKETAPEVRVIGCQPASSCVMARSVAAGRIVEDSNLSTLSDATAGGVERGSITFDICRRLVDDFVLVEEEAIADAMRRLYEHDGLVVEGAAALTVAAVLAGKERFAGRKVVLVLSGGTVDPATASRVGITGGAGDGEEGP